MKVQRSDEISAFGGINFVFDFLESNNFGTLLNRELPSLKSQSQYNWKDIIYALMSVYFCGGEYIEDLGTHLSPHFKKNPFVKIPSPDTVLRRLQQLSEQSKQCKTKRGTVVHSYNTNSILNKLNMKVLDFIGAFNTKEVTIDYDNTILFSEKKDCAMTYKRDKGYQPGVCTLNEHYILYLENRGGNSDAKSFQHETLARMFDLLEQKLPDKPDHFRADAASYQYDVINLLSEKVKSFYIGCRNSYVEKYFSKVTSWQEVKDSTGAIIQVGEIRIKPFAHQAKKFKHTAQEYRLIVKRKQKASDQIDIFTGDAYEYRAILTNNEQLSVEEIVSIYNHRGNMERQFDIMKNDFGWNQMPFSLMDSNTVFLYITAIFRNLYHKIVSHFSVKVKGLKPHYRIKKFLFRFIILPAKWIRHARQVFLRVYGNPAYSP